MPAIICRPSDSRCQFLVLLIRPDTLLPPMQQGRMRVPGEELGRGTIDLQEGQWLVMGEEKHHREKRGWSYVAFTVFNGELLTLHPGERIKAALKVWVGRGPDRKYNARRSKKGIPPRGGLLREHMRGDGEQAAILRLIVAARRGVSPTAVLRTVAAMRRRERMERSREERLREAERLRTQAHLAAVRAKRAAERAAAEQERLDVENGIHLFVP